MSNPGNEVKAKLFAMYYMQEIFVEPMMGKQNPMYFNGANLDDFGDDNYLLLRSIEQLMDEEKDCLIRLINGKDIFEYHLIQSAALKKHNRDFLVYAIKEYNQCWMDHLKATGYLRSIGIALPITYLDENQHPTTASVTDQVSWGWIKLVEK